MKEQSLHLTLNLPMHGTPSITPLASLISIVGRIGGGRVGGKVPRELVTPLFTSLHWLQPVKQMEPRRKVLYLCFVFLCHHVLFVNKSFTITATSVRSVLHEKQNTEKTDRLVTDHTRWHQTTTWLVTSSPDREACQVNESAISKFIKTTNDHHIATVALTQL